MRSPYKRPTPPPPASLLAPAPPAPALSRRWVWLACGSMVLAALVTMVPFPVFNTDTWIQLASGRYFWHYGLPATDPFIYTGERLYAEPEWLRCLLFYFVYTQAGWVGMLGLKCVIRVATYGLMYLTARGLGASLEVITLRRVGAAGPRPTPPGRKRPRALRRINRCSAYCYGAWWPCGPCLRASSGARLMSRRASACCSVWA
jgi:hypothetical protein